MNLPEIKQDANEAKEILANGFWEAIKNIGRFRLKIIKLIFPEFSDFVEKVRKWYWS